MKPIIERIAGVLTREEFIQDQALKLSLQESAQAAVEMGLITAGEQAWSKNVTPDGLSAKLELLGKIYDALKSHREYDLDPCAECGLLEGCHSSDCPNNRPAEITIVTSNEGLIESVDGVPAGMVVVVNDYDIEDYDSEIPRMVDGSGELFIKRVYEYNGGGK